MTLLAIPNVSEGRNPARLREFADLLAKREVRILDVHSDPVHNRSVFTLTANRERLVEGLGEFAKTAKQIDLTRHQGVHPRLGGLDVCPIVPHETSMSEAVQTAHATGETIAERAGLPVYFYGEAALRSETRSLPQLRRGGLERLAARVRGGFPPDAGPAVIDLRRGVVCVGARGPLIAFNVWLDADLSEARRIASRIRASGGGLDGVRALGLPFGESRSQVSMNLLEPETTGIEAAYQAVCREALRAGVEVTGTEIVGLVPERFMPSQNERAARLLIKPGRSLEAVLSLNP